LHAAVVGGPPDSRAEVMSPPRKPGEERVRGVLVMEIEHVSDSITTDGAPVSIASGRDGRRIGLALSGGGVRAAAFHMGVFRVSLRKVCWSRFQSSPPCRAEAL
jgi:hypothetical protein